MALISTLTKLSSNKTLIVNRVYYINKCLKSYSFLSSNRCYSQFSIKNRKSDRSLALRVCFQSTGSNPGSKWIFFSWRSTIISGLIVAVMVAIFLYFKQEKMLMLEQERRRSIGKASLGGKFELIDHNGNKRSSDDFLGKWILLYFGFTHCPDICPDEIEKMVKAVDIIEKDGKLDPIQPLFITVDAERDSVEAVAGYIKEFSPKLIGLTGSKEAVDTASRAYRVYYSAGPKDTQNDYIVDHTIIMYLIDPEGEFVDYYGQTKTAEEIVSGIKLNMRKYKSLKRRFGL